MLSSQLSFNGTASYSREIKFKIELPGAVSRWSFALLIKKGQTKLDYLEEVHIATQELVLVVCIATELTNGSCNHSRKLSVLVRIQH